MTSSWSDHVRIMFGSCSDHVRIMFGSCSDVTVRQFKISSRVCGRFKPLLMPLLRFLKMGPSLPGVLHPLVVTAWQFKSSSRVCCGFKPHKRTLLPFWKMDLSLLGVVDTVAVTVPAVRDQLKGVRQIQANAYAFAAILEDGSVVTWGYAAYGGNSSAVRDQLRGVQEIKGTESGRRSIW